MRRARERGVLVWLEVCGRRIRERRSVISWQTVAARCTEHVPVHDVRCELKVFYVPDLFR